MTCSLACAMRLPRAIGFSNGAMTSSTAAYMQEGTSFLIVREFRRGMSPPKT